MKQELEGLDPNAKCKIYIQRHQTLNTPRVEVLHGVKIKNVIKVLDKRSRRTVIGFSLSIGSHRKSETKQFIKLDHESWAN